ncbi:MAG TPA: carboxypeptidase regulatory-like domain-containing protein, partial [Polyangia bacterium]
PLDGEPAAGAQALSGADGRFALAALDDATYSVKATTRAEGSAIARDVRAGATDVELKLGAVAAILRGRLRDGSGKPITAFTVVAWPRQGVLGRGPEERATVIDVDGRYALPLVPGSYVVSAAARGFARAPDRTVEIGDSGADADFTLARGSRIFGRVVERGSGKPIAGATVAFEGHALGDDIGLQTDVASGADGSFSLEGLPSGRQSLDVQAVGHNGRLLGALLVPEEGALGPLTVDLAPTAPGEEPSTEFVGIGATLSARAEGMIVVNVNPAGGAAEAGLVGGDIVLAIDGQSVEPLGFVGAIQMIRGPEDSIVTLVVKRKDGSVQTIPVRRKRVNF